MSMRRKNSTSIISLVLLTISLLFNLYQGNLLGDRTSELEVLQQDTQIYKSEFELAKRDLRYTKEAIQILRNPKAVKYELRNWDTNAKAIAYLYHDPGTQLLHIDAGNLPPPPDTRQYQLWNKTGSDGTFESLGVFNYQSDKENIFQLKSCEKIKSAMLTLELAPGSATPDENAIQVWMQ